MSLSKQAKIISAKQEKFILSYLGTTRHPLRNKTIFLLSIKAGLRSKEVASLSWGMCLDSNQKVGSFLRLENKAAKGKSGRIIPLNKDLKLALITLYEKEKYPPQKRKVVVSERGGAFSAQTIVNFFQKL
jgi:integrase